MFTEQQLKIIRSNKEWECIIELDYVVLIKIIPLQKLVRIDIYFDADYLPLIQKLKSSGYESIPSKIGGKTVKIYKKG